ncbi:MAG: substrate-binding domain-containing protein [Candidatus Promineifilaceae bacterium]|nr:substrate-binding domain-containing protein [Candidatus Promineifilaceae bacterium]
MADTNTFLYQEIAESLRRRIAAGKLGPGDRLPPVRDLAEQWQCTPGTVSRAYRALADEGLVTARRGSGTHVAPNLLQPERPQWQWAALVNRAEQFLLEALSAGHTPPAAAAALSAAVSRWEALQQESQSEAAGHGPAAGEAPFRFAGSHDLAVDLLRRLLEEEAPTVHLSVEYAGSLGGLMALARGEADVAGAHLWDAASDSYNLPFVRRLFPGRRVALVTLVHRSLGLILPADNAQKVSALSELTAPGVRFVNRQTGSGTRVWLDARLEALDIDPATIAGYEREEATHTAVARAVHEGQATAGLGIHAAAAAYGLGFVGLARERYELVMSEQVRSTPPARALVKVIQSRRFREAVDALGGYDTAETGHERWV